MMKKTLVQPDARGRIQLPKEFRRIPLFEIEFNEEGLQLHPLETRRKTTRAWLNTETTQFIQGPFKKTLQTFFESQPPPEIGACLLYGSRARGDALSNSDIDLALVCSEALNRTRRESIASAIETYLPLRHELQVLRSHRVSVELSIQFLIFPQTDEVPPSLYFNVAEDGQILWQRDTIGQKFLMTMKKLMKNIRAESQGSGRARHWTWSQK